MTHLNDAPADPVTPVLRLLDEMSVHLDDERQELAVLVEEARQAGTPGPALPSAVGVASETLERLEHHASELEVSQTRALRLVDDSIEIARRRAQAVAADANRWAPWWKPPDQSYRAAQPATSTSDVSSPEAQIMGVGHHRQQLARVLLMLGVLLIVSGLLAAVL